MDSRQQITQLQQSITESIIGQEHVVSRLVIGLLANGNLLLEGLPGLAKTRAVKSLARGLATDFSRIQFTPGPAAGGRDRHRGDAHRVGRAAIPLRARPDLR